jgi:hypothetical protein
VEWRDTLGRRLAETVELIGSIDGVSGLILGGGENADQDEAWPLSDVDLVIVYADEVRDLAAAELNRRRGAMEDFWGWAGVSGSLELGALWFTESEAASVVEAGSAGLAARVADPRWFNAMDRAYEGRVVLGRRAVVAELSELFTSARFAADVVAARVRHWRDTVIDALAGLETVAAAEAMVDLCTEHWGGRVAPPSRRWTSFEALADRHGRRHVAEIVLASGGARVDDAAPRLAVAPWWLHRRIDAALVARLSGGEDVTPEQNARDQIVAFAQLWRRRGLPPQPWTEPAPLDPRAAAGDLTTLLRAY